MQRCLYIMFQSWCMEKWLMLVRVVGLTSTIKCVRNIWRIFLKNKANFFSIKQRKKSGERRESTKHNQWLLTLICSWKEIINRIKKFSTLKYNIHHKMNNFRSEDHFQFMNHVNDLFHLVIIDLSWEHAILGTSVLCIIEFRNVYASCANTVGESIFINQ